MEIVTVVRMDKREVLDAIIDAARGKLTSGAGSAKVEVLFGEGVVAGGVIAGAVVEFTTKEPRRMATVDREVRNNLNRPKAPVDEHEEFVELLDMQEVGRDA